MITPFPSGHPASWQQIMQQAVTGVDELLRLVRVERGQLPELDETSPFPLRVPHTFIRRMVPGDPNDPLLRQILPLRIESAEVAGYTDDPLTEKAAGRGRGIISKYRGRALVVTTGACPVHCRYCFRRHFPYNEQALRGGMDDSLAELAGLDHDEVILSGGDPLSLGNTRLRRLFDELQRLPAMRRLRIHTRFPVIVPQRIEPGLLGILSAMPYPLVIVLHINHAREIDGDVRSAVQAMRETGATILNQAVLLAGINDTASSQTDLAESLWEAGILPYYLHQLDPVAGAAHFEVDDRRARDIIDRLRNRLPGYLVPRLVREMPGAAAKTLL